MWTPLQELASRIAAFFGSRSLDSDFDRELESHLAMLEEDGIRRGMTPQQARRAAQLREAHRETRGLAFVDSLLQDVHYALGSLRKAPAFTAAAVLTLGIGIGANTAIFSTIDEALFRPLDFPRLSAFVRMPLNVAWRGRDERLPVEAVTGNFFSMLELPPAAGRAFRDDDDSPAGGRVAMVSEEVAAASSVGEKIWIEDEPFTVVGIVPKRYHGTNLNWGQPPRVWIPLQAEIQTIAAGIAQSAPATDRDISDIVFSASRAKFWPAYRTSITRSLTVFAVAAGLVLLLTCANLSNLLLNRAVGRRREFAIRLSLGAGRGRLVRQLWTESLLLALPSCAAALGIAYGLGGILARFPNALGLPLALDGGVENRVLCFGTALSVISTVLFGLAPALQTTRMAVLPALKESGNTVWGGGHLDQRAAGAVCGASGERRLGLRWRPLCVGRGAGRNGRISRSRDSGAAGRAYRPPDGFAGGVRSRHGSRTTV